MFYVEVIITFMMVSMALHVKHPELSSTTDTVLKEVIFVVTTYAAAVIGSPYSGGCLSPQLCTSEITFEAMLYNNDESSDKMKYLAPWILGPYVGGILAGVFTKYF